MFSPSLHFECDHLSKGGWLSRFSGNPILQRWRSRGFCRKARYARTCCNKSL